MLHAPVSEASKKASGPNATLPAPTRLSHPPAAAPRRCACGGVIGPDGECAACRARRLARAALPGAGTPAVAPPLVHHVLASHGHTLDPGTRAFMQTRFGYDFSGVQVHSDAQAAASAQAVGAHAYTVGSHVVFGAGQYAPDTTRGRHLLAHELAHVVQSSHISAASDLTMATPNSPEEREAESAAAMLSTGWHLRFTPTRQPMLLRQPAPVLRPPPVTPMPIRPVPALRVIEGGLSQATARSVERTGWRFFWRAVARRFALRGATAAALSLADGPLPIGDLIALGMALWMIWDLIQLWDLIWQEAAQLEQAPAEPEPQPAPQPAPTPAPGPSPAPAPAPQREPEAQRNCRQTHPYAPPCTGIFDIEEAAINFLMRNGYRYTDLGTCWGMSSFGENTIDDCDGAPGESWHCSVKGTQDVVSIFGCLCCDEDGETAHEWRGAHWSDNLSRR